MKINNMIKKSGLAIAISAMSAGAMAGTHAVGSLDSGGNFVASDALVLADEIFGQGSEETLVAVPVSTYTVDIGSSGDATVGTEGATIKLTLNQGAVFGQDLSDVQAWVDNNATVVFTIDGTQQTAADLLSDASLEVDQGGAIGDNTVTFKLVAGTTVTSSSTVDALQIGQFRVKNLTSALKRDVNADVKLGAEFRNIDTQDTDTQAAVTVLTSQKGVELAGDVTSYDTSGGRARIDVANSELNFTGDLGTNTGANASQDFDAEDNVGAVDLGSLKVVRTTYGNATPAETVKKENGDDFDFQGSDQPVVTISSSSSLSAYSSVYLRSGSSASCDVTPTTTDFQGVVQADGQSAQISLSGETTADLEAGYRVCAVSGGSERIPEASFDAELNVTYFNPRYTDSQDVLEYGQVLRNGCQVTLFNLPNTGAQDNAFVRLTNVSELDGAVRAFVWTQDGEQIDVNSELVDNLAGHATTVLHTNADLDAGVYLGDAMPTYGAVENGRHRLVVQGAFPACEALGLIRSPNGTLTNMTSTTYSGDEGRLGTDTNGTSNTSN